MKWETVEAQGTQTVRISRSAGAIRAMEQIDANYLIQNGMTKDIARYWRDYYIAIMRENPSNLSAPGRVVLMQYAYKLLGGT